MGLELSHISIEKPGIFIKNSSVVFGIIVKDADLVLLNIEGQPFVLTHLFRTGDLYSCEILNLTPPFRYSYQIQRNGLLSKPVLDPYAKWITPDLLESRLEPASPFTFQASKPNLPIESVIIYELHTKAFTIDPSSEVQSKGTFEGILEKLPYLVSLGINAIELMPIQCFNQTASMWGYMPKSYFALQPSYAKEREDLSLKKLVDACHSFGIEVYLDVVYNHTDLAQQVFGPFSEETYYIKEEGQYLDFTGCGNTLNVDHPIVSDLIIDSLRYLASEFQIDGFRFDLLATLTRDQEGKLLNRSSLITRIEQDPLLSSLKLMGEPWDLSCYRLTDFPSKAFFLWNDRFRDAARRFIKGDFNQTFELANQMLGSPSLFSSHLRSINFITCHDGFSLIDLVCYNIKHNLANLESNQDGSNANFSCNYGKEGPTDDPKILLTRQKQMKNLLLLLFTARGPLLFRMGDEMGKTQYGNNNPYNQDNFLYHLDWTDLSKNANHFIFTQELIAFRKYYAPFFYLTSQLTFHGTTPYSMVFHEQDHYFAFTLEYNQEKLYIGYNAWTGPLTISMPDGAWTILLSTFISSPLEPFYSLTLEGQSSFIAKAL